MVRIFLIISLLLSFTANAQLGKTETENYKGKFEQDADIDEVSDYMLDYQLPIQVLNIGFTPELYEFYPELRENRVGFLFTEDKEDIKQRMFKQHKAAAKGISSNDIKVVGNVVLAEYFVYVEIYDYSVSEEEEVTVNGVKTILKTIIGMQVRFVNAETGTIFTGSGSGEAVTIKRSQIGEDNEVKFNKSTIGIATKKALESGTARIVKRMIKRGIFKE